MPISKATGNVIDVGTSALKIVQLDGSGKLPAVDGSNLTNIGTGPNQLVKLDGSSRLPAVDGSQLTGITTVYPGTVFDYAGTTAPPGYLLCDGSTVSRTTYAALFTAIGTTYGAGNGTTTFGIPDCRGRFTAGKDDMGGTAASRLTGTTGSVVGTTLGAVGGEQNHQLTYNEMPSHSHTFSGTTPQYGTTGTNGYYGNALYGSRTNLLPLGINSAGADLPHNTVPPVIIFNKIIKT
jgi:microcystin-dependent protein